MISKGFTLIELMIVVAIIGVIASISYPSYQGYIRDTYHAQALSDLKVCSLALERYYSNGFTYVGAVAGAPATSPQCSNVSPANATGPSIQYDISFESLSATDFTIKATPSDGSCDGRCIELTADGTQTTL
ncbi:MAG: type IV pilin protein [Pseudomonadales bacterium]